MKIVGFALVKTASTNRYSFAGCKLAKMLTIDGLEYSGIGRLCEDKTLLSVPYTLQKTAEQAIENYSTSLMYSLFLEQKDAENILTNIQGRECFELLGVFSQRLDDIFGSSEYLEDDVIFLGVDIDVDGVFLVKEVLFAANLVGAMDEIFIEDFKNLNEFGVFKSTIEARSFVEHYLHIQEIIGLEIIDENDVEFVSLYRPRS